jgi:integrase
MACITKRRGRYVIDCYDQHGKRYRKSLPEETTKQRAREVLRDIEEKISKRAFVHEKKIPVYGEVAKQWLEYKKENIRITTWEMYEYIIKLHFKEFDDVKISLISTASIEKFITAKRKGQMNISTLRKILGTLNQIMAYAVRHKYIESNPVRDAEKPRNTGKYIGAEKIRVLSPEQINAFLEKVTNQKYYTLFLTAVMTGVRQGELLGLKWSDIDFQKKQAHIRRTFNHGRFFEPKTKGSIRDIDLSPIVIRELAKWKLINSDNELDLVFPSENGTPIDCVNMVKQQFCPVLKAACCPKIRFHDLRHTYASLMIELGVNIKYISNQLGHANPTTTLNIYAHLIKQDNQEAVCKLENTIFRTSGHNLVTNKEKGLTANG